MTIQIDLLWCVMFLNRIGILVPTISKTRKHVIRPMMTAQKSNIQLVYGQAIEIVDGKIYLENQEVQALYDRFPYQKHAHNDPLKKTIDIPVANPRSISLLCKDKWMLQQHMEKHHISMPTVVRSHLDMWRKRWGGSAIAKPRFGSYGAGVSVVSSIPPSTLPSVVGEEETIMQKRIIPPKGWAGIAVRQLAQRLPNRKWIVRTAIVRRSKIDPIVNVHRGAEVVLASSFLPPKTCDDIRQQSLNIANILSDLPQGEWLLELGLDFVIDTNWKPWFIEINAQPKGRLRALATILPHDFSTEYQQCLAQPIQSLHAWILNGEKKNNDST